MDYSQPDTSAINFILGSIYDGHTGLLNNILDGGQGPKRDIAVLNAAAAFVTAGLDNDFKSGIGRAAAAIDSGKARTKLKDLVAFTEQCRPFVRKEL